MRRHDSGADFRSVRRFGAGRPVRLHGSAIRSCKQRRAAKDRDDYREGRGQSERRVPRRPAVEVIKSAVVAPIRLPDVLFPANSSRVNNCGKRILLEQLRAYVERDPTGTVVLVGHTSSDETAANLAQQRAMNSAAVITAGTGVCLSVPQSQVQISAPGADQNGSRLRIRLLPGFGGPRVRPARWTCGASKCGLFPLVERCRLRLRTTRAPVLCR